MYSPENYNLNLADFESATLEDLNSFKLMNRVDQKFIFREDELSHILSEISLNYKVLTLDKTTIFPYNTLYFDTPKLNSYYDHHNGKPNRYKIRYRKYVHSGDVFFEIKKKLKGIRTNKFRIPTHQIPDEIGIEEQKFMNDCLHTNLDVKQSIWVNYNRITLISKNNEERVTIDLHVHFKNQDHEFPLTGLVILEIKQPKISKCTELVKSLRNRHIRETRISKYGIGLALLNGKLKQNAFGSKLRKIHYLIDGKWKQAS